MRTICKGAVVPELLEIVILTFSTIASQIALNLNTEKVSKIMESNAKRRSFLALVRVF